MFPTEIVELIILSAGGEEIIMFQNKYPKLLEHIVVDEIHLPKGIGLL